MVNEHLRRRREATLSPSGNGQPMTHAELAEAVNQYIWKATARHCSLDADTLRRYERGRIRWPGADYRAGLRAVLGAESDRELGFYPTRRGRAAKAASQKPPQFEPADEFTSWLKRSAAVDALTLENLAVRTDDIRVSDRAQFSDRTVVMLKGHIETLSSLRAYSLSPLTRQRLSAVFSDAASLAGWVHLDRGDVREAWRLHEAAKDAAREIPGHGDLAHAIAQQAYVLVDVGRPLEAMSLAEQAVSVAQTRVSAPLRSWLHGVAGEIAAILGDSGSSMRHFERAVALLPADAHDPDAPYVVLDEHNLARWRGSALARLGDEAAITDLQHALGGVNPAHLRAGAQLNTDLAHSLAAADHLHEACEALSTARPLAARAGSARQELRIKKLELRLRREIGEQGKKPGEAP